jgi:RNA polymerase sigma-70 factor (ECF subfamily)
VRNSIPTGAQVSDADAQDIRAGLEGDGDAYARLVERYQAKVAGRMWRFTRDKGDHQELVQEVFVQAYLSLGTYRGEAPFEHWLSRIATTVGYKYWKRRSVERSRIQVPVEDLDRLVGEDPVELDPSQAAEMLHSLLDKLPPRDRLVLTLRYVEDRSVQETSMLTGWTNTMVKVQAWRARKKLRQLFEEAGVEVD